MFRNYEITIFRKRNIWIYRFSIPEHLYSKNIYIYIHSDLTIGIEQNTPIRDSVYKSVMLLDSDRCNEELSSVLYVLFKHKNDYLKWKLKNV